MCVSLFLTLVSNQESEMGLLSQRIWEKVSEPIFILHVLLSLHYTWLQYLFQGYRLVLRLPSRGSLRMSLEGSLGMSLEGV